MKEILHRISENIKGFAYKEYIYDSWNDIKTFLFKFTSNNNSYVFRGHADESWELKPTIDRFSLSDTVAVENKAIIDFKKDISLFVKDNDISFLNNSKGDLECLALMQHHGAATRLLDFSVSPFVASFFAFFNINNDKTKRCLWALPLKYIDEKNQSFSTDRTTILEKLYSELKIDKKGKYNMLGYSFLNKRFERIFRQKGCFVYSLSSEISFLGLLPKYFDDSSLEKTPLIKITFSNNDKMEMIKALKELNFMNISHSSLFPDIDGFGRDILLSEAMYDYLRRE